MGILKLTNTYLYQFIFRFLPSFYDVELEQGKVWFVTLPIPGGHEVATGVIVWGRKMRVTNNSLIHYFTINIAI